MTQEFHISVTPIGGDDYLVRTERVAPGVPLAEEQVNWPVDEWLERAKLLMNDPLTGLLRSDDLQLIDLAIPVTDNSPEAQRSLNLSLFGQQLYNALFQGTLRDSWMTAQGIAQHRQDVLRLRLGLKDHRLPRLPWEVLHTGDRPIAARTDLVFSRYHSSFAVMSSPFQLQQIPAVEPGQPLKILLVLAAPTDQEVLALKQEALHLQEELQGSLRNGNKTHSEIQITLLEQPGREQLTQALEHNHYHVLHYAGHSNLGTAGGKLYLVSNKTGLTETLSGDDLAGLLVNNGIRMAVFNSCRGGYTASGGAEDGLEGNLVEALVKRGIPAVLAMAERIPDDVALNLSRLFYRNIKQLYPIDLSLNRARQGLLSSYGSNQMYWALPILYLHPKFDGCLLPVVEEEVEPAPVANPGLEIRDQKEAIEDKPVEETLNGNGYAPTDAWTRLGETEQPELDDPEFGDLEYQQELETVARLVNQLSQNSATRELEDKPLPASPGENLLPEAEDESRAGDYLILPEKPDHVLSQSGGFNNSNGAGNGISAQSELLDSSVYVELEQLLAESGKPTEMIAACNRAIQDDPTDSLAYDRLGQALSQQGYLAEAIVAYQQALHLNPSLADAHYHLGQTYYQQGNVRQAIRAYSQALQINPQLVNVRHSLEVALQRQGVQLPPEQKLSSLPPQPSHERAQTTNREPAGTRPSQPSRPIPAPPPTPSAPPTSKTTHRRTPSRSLLWIGAGAIGMSSLLLGVWFLHGRMDGLVSLPVFGQSIPGELPNPKNLKQASTTRITAFATQQLNQGDIPNARRAIEILLDRGALPQAAVALTPALNRQGNNATIDFLMGRLAWQFLRKGNKLYSVEDARRSWERAAENQPTVPYQNALGFAYYSKSDLERASEAWLRALQLAGAGEQTTANASSQTSSPGETLTAYAGLALVSMQKAEKAPSTTKARLLKQAIELREKVLSEDPVNFQPKALSQNWLWSDKTIQDWRKLLSLK